MYRKNRPLLIFLILIAVISACGSKAPSKIPQDIDDTIKKITFSVANKDMEGFLKFIDSENNEFYAEEKHWFEDMTSQNIEHYVIHVETVSKLEPYKYKVSFNQEGMLNKNKFSIKSTGIFRQVNGTYKFSDLVFDIKQTEHFIIKYSPSLRKQAEAFSLFVDKAYDKVRSIYGNVPADRTVIKLYDNDQTFNWYIKPSINFAMSGWYEYPESIKINMSSVKSYDNPNLEKSFINIISHELTHRTNMLESNNNIPYWMAEGIATYVQNGGIINISEPEMNIQELENVNIEKLNRSDEISAYYNSAYINISKFIKKYKIEKLHELIAELKKYPLQQKTGGQSIAESNQKFHESLVKHMSITFDQLEEELSSTN